MTTRSSTAVAFVLIAAGVGVVAIGCGSGGGSQATDAATPAPCGDAAACAVTEVCVSVQGCGTSTCTPVPDGGTCPTGSTATATCPETGQPGCIGGCPVTYSCEARPAGCAAAVDCTCAAPLCSPGTCIATMGSRVACGAL
ncbi:MAG TPA: hypothetical protein VN903_34385 [Polyangia bacterium]|nr:hypothetical protein [Polyangia bacterium]